MSTKFCNFCKQEKSIDDFGKCKTFKDGLSIYCKSCNRSRFKNIRAKNKEHYRMNRRNDYYRLYQGKADARYYRLKYKAGKDFTIDRFDFQDWYNTQPKTCHYCSCKLTFGDNKLLTCCTIDRKNPDAGYILSNMVLSCRRCNTMKGNWLTHDQTLEIAQKYFSVKQELSY